MVHICKGNFPTVFSNHCHHGYCGGRAQSTINIFNNCGGGHTNFWGGFGAGLGFGLGNLFGGFGMGNIFGGFGSGNGYARITLYSAGGITTPAC